MGQGQQSSVPHAPATLLPPSHGHISGLPRDTSQAWWPPLNMGNVVLEPPTSWFPVVLSAVS